MYLQQTKIYPQRIHKYDQCVKYMCSNYCKIYVQEITEPQKEILFWSVNSKDVLPLRIRLVDLYTH